MAGYNYNFTTNKNHAIPFHILDQRYQVNIWRVTLKGQIKSEWIYEIVNFPKNDPKNLKDFYPESFYST